MKAIGRNKILEETECPHKTGWTLEGLARCRLSMVQMLNWLKSPNAIAATCALSQGPGILQQYFWAIWKTTMPSHLLWPPLHSIRPGTDCQPTLKAALPSAGSPTALEERTLQTPESPNFQMLFDQRFSLQGYKVNWKPALQNHKREEIK